MSNFTTRHVRWLTRTHGGHHTKNFYVQVTFSKEDRLSIGCPVPKILAFEERPHGRPAAHTQDFPFIQFELARSLHARSLVIIGYRNNKTAAIHWKTHVCTYIHLLMACIDHDDCENFFSREGAEAHRRLNNGRQNIKNITCYQMRLDVGASWTS